MLMNVSRSSSAANVASGRTLRMSIVSTPGLFVRSRKIGRVGCRSEVRVDVVLQDFASRFYGLPDGIGIRIAEELGGQFPVGVQRFFFPTERFVEAVVQPGSAQAGHPQQCARG